jgi:hypothetical protein
MEVPRFGASPVASMTVDVIEERDESKSIVKPVPAEDTATPETPGNESHDDAQPVDNATSREDSIEELPDDAETPSLDCYV